MSRQSSLRSTCSTSSAKSVKSCQQVVEALPVPSMPMTHNLTPPSKTTSHTIGGPQRVPSLLQVEDQLIADDLSVEEGFSVSSSEIFPDVIVTPDSSLSNMDFSSIKQELFGKVVYEIDNLGSILDDDIEECEQEEDCFMAPTL